MVWRARRVVTGHDIDGQSILLMDGLAPNLKEMSALPGLALTDLWETTTSPASNAGEADGAERPVRLEPPPRGTIFRIVELPPDAAWRGKTNAREGFDSIGASHAQDQQSADPMMHTTATIDYIVVLKGEIYAIVDKGETLLKAGDVLIQRGTRHSWSVRGNAPCILAAILVGADPYGAAVPSASNTSSKKRVAAKKAPSKAARKAGVKSAPAKRAKKAVKKKR
ncbi:MAG: cupin domain-containing protein [Burkholderiales bacterium]